MSAETVISFISMVVSVMAFGVVYNKAVKNRVDKTELKDLQSYVDKQDDAIGHRVDGLEKRLDDGLAILQKDVKDILKILSK